VDGRAIGAGLESLARAGGLEHSVEHLVGRRCRRGVRTLAPDQGADAKNCHADQGHFPIHTCSLLLPHECIIGSDARAGQACRRNWWLIAQRPQTGAPQYFAIVLVRAAVPGPGKKILPQLVPPAQTLAGYAGITRRSHTSCDTLIRCDEAHPAGLRMSDI